jgi:hypothetical protein
MRRLVLYAFMLILTVNAMAGSKDKGKTTLKDFQPAGTTDKNHKKLQYDLSFVTQSGKDYMCRTKENEKIKATDFVVGSDMTYEVNGNKGKVKISNGKQVDCTIVRVANAQTAAK